MLRYFRMTSGRPVIVAGSTMREEEQIVLQAFRRIKAEHRQSAARASRRAIPNGSPKSRSWRATRRSSPPSASDLPIDAEPRADVVVLDTIGELAQVYQIATAVFVGGSLVDTGGHNILEPAVFGKPIVFGPHMHNFKEIAEAFIAQDAAVQVTGARGARRGAAGAADRSGAARPAGRRGARARRVESRRQGQVPRDDRAAVAAARRHRWASCARSAWSTERLLDLLYSRLARARRRYYQRRPYLRRRLAAPVISIGNLTVGGSGKTPLAAEIARMLLEMGERPSILSRGYAQKDPSTRVWSSSATAAACSTGVERSGDEPQMLARAVPGAAVLVSRAGTWPDASPRAGSDAPCTCWTTAFSISI